MPNPVHQSFKGTRSKSQTTRYQSNVHAQGRDDIPAVLADVGSLSCSAHGNPRRRRPKALRYDHGSRERPASIVEGALERHPVDGCAETPHVAQCTHLLSMLRQDSNHILHRQPSSCHCVQSPTSFNKRKANPQTTHSTAAAAATHVAGLRLCHQFASPGIMQGRVKRMTR